MKINITETRKIEADVNPVELVDHVLKAWYLMFGKVTGVWMTANDRRDWLCVNDRGELCRYIDYGSNRGGVENVELPQTAQEFTQSFKAIERLKDIRRDFEEHINKLT